MNTRIICEKSPVHWECSFRARRIFPGPPPPLDPLCTPTSPLRLLFSGRFLIPFVTAYLFDVAHLAAAIKDSLEIFLGYSHLSGRGVK